MIAIDTNVLVYSEMTTSPQHVAARRLVVALAEGDVPWAIPWPCVYEYLRVVTHPKVYHPPMPIDLARNDLARLLAAPTLVLLGETDRHARIMDEVLRESRAAGNLVHDAHIAALCLEHGVRELLTADRDFARFSGLRIRDPFAQSEGGR